MSQIQKTVVKKNGGRKIDSKKRITIFVYTIMESERNEETTLPSLTEATELKQEDVVVVFRRKVIPRKCGYCKIKGHNIVKCEQRLFDEAHAHDIEPLVHEAIRDVVENCLTRFDVEEFLEDRHPCFMKHILKFYKIDCSGKTIQTTFDICVMKLFQVIENHDQYRQRCHHFSVKQKELEKECDKKIAEIHASITHNYEKINRLAAKNEELFSEKKELQNDFCEREDLLKRFIHKQIDFTFGTLAADQCNCYVCCEFVSPLEYVWMKCNHGICVNCVDSHLLYLEKDECPTCRKEMGPVLFCANWNICDKLNKKYNINKVI
jgi:hypothetical protein